MTPEKDLKILLSLQKKVSSNRNVDFNLVALAIWIGVIAGILVALFGGDGLRCGFITFLVALAVLSYAFFSSSDEIDKSKEEVEMEMKLLGDEITKRTK